MPEANPPVVILATLTAMAIAGAGAYQAVNRWPTAHLAAPEVHPPPVSAVRRPFLARRLDPASLTGLALTAAASLTVVASVAVAVTLRMVRRHDGIALLDDAAARWGAQQATPASTQFLQTLSWFGSTIGVVVVTAAVAVVGARRGPTRAVGGFLALVVLGQLLVANTIKSVVGRERPDIDRLTSFAGPSFPSGHSVSAAACFAAAALVLGRYRSRRVKATAAGAATAMAVGVAGSRVLLGVHWFTDVVAGLMLGWGWFALCSIAFGGRLLRFGAPAAEAARPGRTGLPSRRSVKRRPAGEQPRYGPRRAGVRDAK